jgi:hypothetical protein
MMKQPLLLLVLSLAVCGMASAGPLVVSASGQFASSDSAGPLVAPNGLFYLSFVVNSNPTPLAGTVTSVEFDVPVQGFVYQLNNVPLYVVPSEITFYTLGDGGLFNVAVGSGLSSEDFEFQGAQAFSGTTAAPVLTTGNYSVSSWTYSDPGNYDFETPASGSVNIAPTPEPSTILLTSGSLIALICRKFRKR